MAKERRAVGGRAVAITGGARGIGKAIAAELVRRGARPAIGDLDLATAERAAAELGGGTVALPLDVTDRDSFAAFLDGARERLGALDGVVNNAGIMPVTPIDRESEDSIRRQIEINLVGVITGTRLAIERLRPRGEGWIVNIASQAGKVGLPGIATYAATKHGVVGFSEAVRAELRGSGVEVVCVMPTLVNTELTSGVGQRWVRSVEPEDVARAVVDAMETGRFEVFVPRSNGWLLRFAALMPRRAAEAIGRLMGTDRLMTEVDEAARRAYEERAAASAGGARAGASHEKTAAGG